MKLSDIKKNADEKKAAKLAEERKAKILADLDIHPLVKEGSVRNIRDAYFCGIAFAAFTDDLKMDAQEKKIVCRIGCSLGIPGDEQDEMIRAVQHNIEQAVNDGGEHVFALLEDCASEIKEESARRLFAAEYVKVCASKEYDHDDVCSCLAKYVYRDDDEKLDKQMTTLCEQLFSVSGKVDSAVLVDLSEILGDDVVRYLMLDVCGHDVAPLLKMERERRKLSEKEESDKKSKAKEQRIRKLVSIYCDVVDQWLGMGTDVSEPKKPCVAKRAPQKKVAAPKMLSVTVDDFFVDAEKLLSLRNYLTAKGYDVTMTALLFEKVEQTFKTELSDLLDKNGSRLGAHGMFFKALMGVSSNSSLQSALLRKSIWRLAGISLLRKSQIPTTLENTLNTLLPSCLCPEDVATFWDQEILPKMKAVCFSH